MQLSIILSATMAVLAAAAPQLAVRNGGPGGGHSGGGGGGSGGGKGSCNADVEKQVCCNGLLSCVVQAVSSGCTNQAYCCKTDSPVGALISISALNCLQL
ncbi:hypothetical protein QBC33DRAFT_574123 [Phialemonium atrogriseum]|uniref:Hydrophobin n=1 Tax=Phialemonium atrogriseum TaxID=1093897 RepID=A0AAJ0BQT0_9PEZI|nr:uncharacterized protein QBC33DRAFT_574123 [Phialemonium atrogriseum]KAK1762505.1 hypothetical protein QBC33DRAFT_574123 [Phialemonium atrogriseum]